MKKYKVCHEVVTSGGNYKVARTTKATVDEAVEYIVSENKYDIMYDKMDEVMFDIEINDEMVKAADTEKNQATINGWLEEKKDELIEEINDYCRATGTILKYNHWTIEAYEEYHLYQNGNLGMTGPFDEIFRYIHDYCPYKAAAQDFFNYHVHEIPVFLSGELGNLLFPDEYCTTDFSDNIFSYIKDELKSMVDANGSAVFAGVVISAEPIETTFSR